MLAFEIAVVRGEEKHGVLREAALFEFLRDPSYAEIHAGNTAVVIADELVALGGLIEEALPRWPTQPKTDFLNKGVYCPSWSPA